MYSFGFNVFYRIVALVETLLSSTFVSVFDCNLQESGHSFFTLGVKFINILRAHFLYASALCSFLQLHFSFVIFGTKISVQNVHKIMMKLTLGCKASTNVYIRDLNSWWICHGDLVLSLRIEPFSGIDRVASKIVKQVEINT